MRLLIVEKPKGYADIIICMQVFCNGFMDTRARGCYNNILEGKFFDAENSTSPRIAELDCGFCFPHRPAGLNCGFCFRPRTAVLSCGFCFSSSYGGTGLRILFSPSYGGAGLRILFLTSSERGRAHARMTEYIIILIPPIRGFLRVKVGLTRVNPSRYATEFDKLKIWQTHLSVP